jgi:hypothetical protein
MHVAVGHTGMVSINAQPISRSFSNDDRAMLSTGTTERNGQIALRFRLISGEQQVEKAL